MGMEEDFNKKFEEYTKKAQILSLEEHNIILEKQKNCTHNLIKLPGETEIFDDDNREVIGKLVWFACKKCYVLFSKEISLPKGKSLEVLINIVKRLIELKKEYWDKHDQEKAHSYNYYRYAALSDGMENALEVIDGFTNFNKEIHKLIEESRKCKNYIKSIKMKRRQ